MFHQIIELIVLFSPCSTWTGWRETNTNRWSDSTHRRNQDLKKQWMNPCREKFCETILWTCSGPNVLRWPHSDFLTTLEMLFQENWSPFCAGGKKILTEWEKISNSFSSLKSLLWYIVFVKTSLCQPACFYTYCQWYILIFNTVGIFILFLDYRKCVSWRERWRRMRGRRGSGRRSSWRTRRRPSP